jgi:truncated hemoglobin YjbI
MSKFELQEQALLKSGVSFVESQEAIHLRPSLFERLGEDGFEELSTLFYDRVFADKGDVWFLNIFSSSTKSEAIDNQVSFWSFLVELNDEPRKHVAHTARFLFFHPQYRFFAQTFGGPDLYR